MEETEKILTHRTNDQQTDEDQGHEKSEWLSSAQDQKKVLSFAGHAQQINDNLLNDKTGHQKKGDHFAAMMTATDPIQVIAGIPSHIHQTEVVAQDPRKAKQSVDHCQKDELVMQTDGDGVVQDSEEAQHAGVVQTGDALHHEEGGAGHHQVHQSQIQMLNARDCVNWRLEKPGC